MKKNLKKVISAVIAFALSASTVATVSFATGYDDVASTASYAEAVKVISALGIVQGKGEGKFEPETTLKRAEAAKMIVGMINKIEAAESRKGATQFTDVPAEHWGTGFINVGTTEKFINGMGDGKFDPEGSLTYNQLIKMIVCCLGYEEYAQFYGGYPNGYVSIADSEGITKGCSMDGNAAVTRAVAAQLIYNALKTPIIEPKGMQYSATAGGFVPNIEKQDGEESKYYKTLLTEKWDAYLVEGRVTSTQKQGQKVGETLFDIDKAEEYNSMDIYEGATNLLVNVGNTAAADYIHTYSTAIIMDNDDGEFSFVSFIPSGKNKSVNLDASLFDDEKYVASEAFSAGALIKDAKFYYYESDEASRSTKYELDKNASLYVNGIQVAATETNFNKYVINNPVGAVELIDTYKKNQSADGAYDIVNVEYFVTARVDAVSSKKITLAETDAKLSGMSITLDVEDNEELVYHIYLNDEEIAITDLKKDDILSIATDTTTGKLNDNNFYDIYVSREVVEGKYSGQQTDDEEITVAGEQYKFVGNYTSEVNSLTMGNEYKFMLDSFGRIFNVETIANSAKIAILDRYYNNSSYDNWVGRFYLADGSVKIMEIDLSRMPAAYDTRDELAAKVYNDKDNISQDDKTPIYKRVVEYKVSSSTQKVISLTFLSEKSATAEFSTRTNAIGAIRMNDATTVVDATEYWDLAQQSAVADTADLVLESVTSLTDGVEYTAYAFGDQDSSRCYPFVIITEGQGAYTIDTMLAVVSGTLQNKTNEAGDEGFEVEVLYKNAADADVAQKLFVADDALVDGSAIDSDNPAASLAKGDLIAFQVNAKGNIDEIMTVVSAASIGIDTAKSAEDSYNATVAKGLDKDFSKFISTDAASVKYWSTAWNKKDSDFAEIVYGVVIDKASNDFTLGQIGTGVVNGDYTGIYTEFNKEATADTATGDAEGATKNIGLTDDTRVYVCDYNANRKADMFFVGSKGEITKTFVPDSYLLENATNGADVIGWDYEVEAGVKLKDAVTINFAFAKVVNGLATDVYVIKGYDN